MTARSIDLGKATLNEFQSEGLKNIDFCQLDVTDPKSVVSAFDFVKEKYGKINCLINNAGWASHGPEINADIARKTIETNYNGLKLVTKTFLPIVTDRVVNVTSSAGQMNNQYSQELRDLFLSDSISETQLDELCDRFIKDCDSGKYLEKGWPASTYRVSKAAANTLTRIFARDYSNGVTFYACCPGYVKTDMTSQKGIKSTEEGAETPIWLATVEKSMIKNGHFYRDIKEIDF